MSVDALAAAYFRAKFDVKERGFAAEIEWQETLSFYALTEAALLREAAWVILNAGMRESVIRPIFPDISSAFNGWLSAEDIVRNGSVCVRRALEVFDHSTKVAAILRFARHVHHIGFILFAEQIERRGISAIEGLPFMGPVTSIHLLKNIGFDVVKPDRHLLRVADAVGYESPEHLCAAISDASSDSVRVIDVVLWRFCAENVDAVAKLKAWTAC